MSQFRERLRTRREKTKLDQSIEKLRRSLSKSLTNLEGIWNDGKSISTRDKIAFVSAVGNIFATALLLGMAPEKLPIWYTGQMIYYMPLRFFSYHRRGYHYFIADLCYWVNLLAHNVFLTSLITACPVFVGFPVVNVSFYCHILPRKWTRRMGYHCLEKLTSPPLLVHP